MPSLADRLSLSSCWCSARHTDGYEMVQEMRELGFKRIELSHGIRISLVAGILKAVEEEIIEISSVHNFCPLPNMVQHAAPNLYEPSSKDVRELNLWNRYSLQTLDFAMKVGAPRIVMHSGSIHFFFRSPEAQLDKWIGASGLEANELSANEDFQKRRDRAMKQIRRRAPAWLDRTRESYEKLFQPLREQGIRLGIENRESLEELPLDADFDDFLISLGEDAPVGYWHDAGHAQIKHQLGLLDHAEHLAKMAPKLIGFHLHDVSEKGKDHQPPGTGTNDFKMIASHVRPEHTLVLELSPSLSSDQVRASRDYILECF